MTRLERILTPERVEGYSWIIVFTILFLSIGQSTDWGSRLNWPIPPSTAGPTAFAAPKLETAFIPPAPDTMLETSLRPLFVVTRRPAPTPPPPAPPAPPKPTMKKGQFLLTGVTIVANQKFAHILDRASNKSVVVSEGKDIGGITIKQISETQVILTQYDDTEVLVLRSPVKLPASK